MTKISSDKHFRELKRQRRNLLIRNWLNGIFIILAILSIIGVLVFEVGDVRLYISYGIAILAILVKVVESVFRMPGIFHKL